MIKRYVSVLEFMLGKMIQSSQWKVIHVRAQHGIDSENIQELLTNLSRKHLE